LVVPGLAVEAEIMDHLPPHEQGLVAHDQELVDEVDIRLDGLDGEPVECLEVLRVVAPVGAAQEHPQAP